MGAGVLQLAGSEEQKQEWLPKIVSGEAILTPAWIEPERGLRRARRAAPGRS